MKYTIITGGGSGLGYELAQQLLEYGKNIIIIGRNIEKLESAAKMLSLLNRDRKVKYFSLNIANLLEVEDFFYKIKKEKIEIEFLFNNVGKGFYGDVETLDENDIKSVIDSNLIGLINMTSKSVKHMKSLSNKCRIVNVLSTAALNGKRYESIYNAAKFGAKGFLESVKDELKGSNIEIQVFFPGGMNTPFWNDVNSGYDFTTFMSPAHVAEEIISMSMNENMLISDVVINRRK